MPRKTKETEKEKVKVSKVKVKNPSSNSKKKSNIKKDVKAKESKAKVSKKVSSTKKSTVKKVDSKASTTKEKKAPKAKIAPVKKTTTTKKKTTTKKASTAKKVASKTSSIKEKKATKAKITPVKKTTTTKKKATTKKVSTTKKVALKVYSPEYYDLPFKYNKTVVTILAQTPTNLFIYWEISDEDRNKLKEQYGEYFFEITKPVLIIHNLTKKYSFEIDINDFANSWYVNVTDSDCEYKIELGRRPTVINYNYIPQYDVVKYGPIAPIKNPYIYISSSNELMSPNDRVLFNWSDEIYFKNVKTKEVIVKHIKDLSFIDRYGKIISLYELYKKEYGDDFLRNPSSGSSSSLSFSSNFK